jgi:hypothetical protein
MSTRNYSGHTLFVQTFRAEGGFMGTFTLQDDKQVVLCYEVVSGPYSERVGVVREAVSFVQRNHPEIATQLNGIVEEHELEGGLADFNW